MSSVVGSEFPKGVHFGYIPYKEETKDIKACGFPLQLYLDKVVPGKKVVIVAVPGAFTPTCTANHLPPYAEKYQELKAKGVDQVIVLAANDPFVMSAFGKAENLADKFIFASDVGAEFSKSLGFSIDMTKGGMGVRTGRYALIVEDGKITYAGNEEDPSQVTVSGVDAVLKHL